MIDVEFVSINDYEGFNKNESVLLRKSHFNLKRYAYNMSKNSECLLCNKVSTSIHSHTIPHFILIQLAEDGMLVTGTSMFNNPIIDEKVGTKNALIFMNICSDCDNLYFKYYEDPNHVLMPYNQIIMREIALKNYLRILHKKNLEYYELKNLLDDHNTIEPQAYIERLRMTTIDLDWYKKTIEKIKRNKVKFYLIDEFTLDYSTKIAFQGSIALIVDIDGNIVNNVFNYNPKYEIQELHICVFPYNGKTKISLFIIDGNRRYSSFYKRFRKLSVKDKIYVINQIILKYSDDYVVTPSLRKIIRDDKSTMDKISMTSDTYLYSDRPFQINNNSNEYMSYQLQEAKDKYKLTISGDDLNLLSNL